MGAKYSCFMFVKIESRLPLLLCIFPKFWGVLPEGCFIYWLCVYSIVICLTYSPIMMQEELLWLESKSFRLNRSEQFAIVVCAKTAKNRCLSYPYFLSSRIGLDRKRIKGIDFI